MLTTTQPIPPSLQAAINRKASLCGLTPFAVLTALVIDGLNKDAENNAKQPSQQEEKAATRYQRVTAKRA